ncbi:tail fiber protein [Qipengyuania sp. MTN3-11]|uniref:tail fiber protein n=1 Tax=Qipengyuania sp. MTN3-11 TaxID=3056557 RepID=UPI0036F1F341
MLDIEQALSSSVDRDGKGGMRANLPMGGNRITNLAPGIDSTDAVTMSQVSGGGGTSIVAVPVGAVIDYWGSTPPAGFLFAAGQAVSRSTYSALFAIIGTTAGAGDGSTTFNLPDYRGRVSSGRENMALPASTRLTSLSSSTLGATGGAQTHTLTTAQMPAHSHTVTDPGHTHSSPSSSGTAGVVNGFDDIAQTTSGTATTGSAATGITVASAGSGEAHNNVQPTIIANKIIRAL